MPGVEDEVGLRVELLQQREHGRHDVGHLDHDVVHLGVDVALALHPRHGPDEPPELVHVHLALDEQPVSVDERPRLGHDPDARHPGKHLADEGGPASRRHVDEGQLAVHGVADLVAEAVQGRDRHHNQLTGSEEVDDEDERSALNEEKCETRHSILRHVCIHVPSSRRR